MNFTSIATPSIRSNVRTAVEHGLAPDGSLYVPEYIPSLSEGFFQTLNQLSLEEIAHEVLFPFFSDGLNKGVFQQMIETWCAIPTPLVHFEDRIVVELFHGPTQAFKDFGAQWMAILFREYQQQEDREIHFLVATSGDTGGAVAEAFHKVEGIRVTILYPEGRVSEQQELQMKSFGANINVMPISGSFDECQSLVKRAFNDKDLRKQVRLSSANSINVARWIPQCVYYYYAYRDCHRFPKGATFVVPCGNLGNLSAGILAQVMGLPVEQWICSTNENDVFLRYINTGAFEKQPTKVTLANAMDVGLPNNLERIHFFQRSTWNIDQLNIECFSIIDEDIRKTIIAVIKDESYQIDPHTATAWHACSKWQSQNKVCKSKPIILSTASSDKFKTSIENIIRNKQYTREPLIHSQNTKNVDQQYDDLKEYLMSIK